MTQPSPKHREEARAVQLPFPCGCLDAHTGGELVVEEYTCKSHRAIASALSTRDTEIREVLEGLMSNAECWCGPNVTGGHEHACLAARELYQKVQVVEEGSDGSSVDD